MDTRYINFHTNNENDFIYLQIKMTMKDWNNFFFDNQTMKLCPLTRLYSSSYKSFSETDITLNFFLGGSIDNGGKGEIVAEDVIGVIVVILPFVLQGVKGFCCFAALASRSKTILLPCRRGAAELPTRLTPSTTTESSSVISFGYITNQFNKN